MCNASEAVYERGWISGERNGEIKGEMKKAKETTFTLADRGMTISDIASILKISEKQVKEWLSEVASLV